VPFVKHDCSAVHVYAFVDSRGVLPAAMTAFRSVCSVLLLFATAATAAVICPPAGFDSATGINVRHFINGPWYVQEQVGVNCARVTTQITN
jgi:hypothetical protein